MSLGIAFKGPEGIVLAADSRVTLTAELDQGQGKQKVLLPATYDNATKLLRVAGQDFAGAVTYGAGAIGGKEPRTAHSFLPEFEAELAKAGRLKVEDFAEKLSDFFLRQWKSTMPADYKGPSMVFIVGGYDPKAPYGRVFEIQIPAKPKPEERNPGSDFGFTWGGQRDFVDRLIQGFDDQLPAFLQQRFKLDDPGTAQVRQDLKQQLSARIPYQFLPLQDCVDMAIFLIKVTIQIQTWVVGVRGVGGAIDVATITRTDGFKPIQTKKIIGEIIG